MFLPILSLLAAQTAPLPPLAPADLILAGGRVWAGKGLPEATAIAIRGESVVAVGPDAEILKWKGPRTRVVDLKGRRVVPGFNDAHLHFTSGGFGLLSLDLRPASGEADMARRVAAFAAASSLPPGRWITGGRWDHESWASKALPTRASLDPVTPGNPVFVSRVDGHQGLANSLALKAAGITRETPDPAGGTIVKGPDGEPTGILKDNAMDLVTRVIPPPSPEETVAAVRAAMKEAARLGVTSVQDDSPASSLRAYRDLRRAGELTVRINAWQGSHSLGALQAAGMVGGIGDDSLRIGPVKLFADGSMGSGTAAFFAPYADDPSTSGLLVTGDAPLRALIRQADAAGFQVAVHAIGDRANALALDAFEEIGKAAGRPAARPRVEHAQVIREADLARFRALGAVASIQPSHCITDMSWAERRIGPVRVHDAYRFRSLLAAGIPVAFGTDWSVEPLDPRIGLYAAVTREFQGGGPKGGWHPEERLTIEEALDLYTRGSAYAEFQEGRKGTLEPGRLADLVVLGADLLQVAKTDPRAILTTPVDMTVVGGRVVFERSRQSP
jgi:predicted amidohydrolase YtcJ